jgi:hypothetical protein
VGTDDTALQAKRSSRIAFFFYLSLCNSFPAIAFMKMPDISKATHPSALIINAITTSRKIQYLFACNAFAYHRENMYRRYNDNLPASNNTAIVIAAINKNFPTFFKMFIMIFFTSFHDEI